MGVKYGSDNEGGMQGSGSPGGAVVSGADGGATANRPAVPVLPKQKGRGSVAEAILLVIVCLVAVAAIIFAVYFYLQWNEAQMNVDGKIAAAEAVAREDQQTIDEANFAEREKQPNLEFVGPGDYGSLSFRYPRTWSVYVAKDASGGGDFEAYFNPGQVNEVSETSINALRLTIYNRRIEEVRTSYDSLVSAGNLTMSVFSVGDITGDRFEGAFNEDIVGSMVMFKINDKTVVLRADAGVFKSDFNALIATMKHN